MIISVMYFWETLNPTIQMDTTLSHNPTQTVLKTKVPPLTAAALPNGAPYIVLYVGLLM